MSEERVLSIEEGTLAYIQVKDGIAVRRYRGVGTRAAVPECIEDMPVVSIERKAFLSCKTLREIILPDTVCEIGDWAFAHAEALRRITVPRHALTRGKELFLGCKRLREIILSGSDAEREFDREQGIGRMLAAAVTALHDYVLFDPPQVKSGAWVNRWDEQLLKLVRLDDLDGFEELWTCGEEDYEGKDYDIKSYPVEKRKAKLRLVYFRLLHPFKLSDAVYKELQAYLGGHTKGTAEPEAWDIILEEHPQELSYYQAFTAAGCVNEDNFDALLEDMREINAEIKAYMLCYRDGHLAKKDAFASFELDW